MKQETKEKIIKAKGWIIGVGSFALLGGVGALIGFEIANDWHAIRKWLSSPYASTFFIVLAVGIVALGLLVLLYILVKNNGKYK